jgi:hypothetical protein
MRLTLSYYGQQANGGGVYEVIKELLWRGSKGQRPSADEKDDRGPPKSACEGFRIHVVRLLENAPVAIEPKVSIPTKQDRRSGADCSLFRVSEVNRI